MQAMRRTHPPYVYRERTRHGRWVLYFRRGKGRRIRLPDDIASDEFQAAYQAALTGNAPPSKTTRTPPHSLAWLIERYAESAAWQQLSVLTRKQRESIFREAIKRSDNAVFAAITEADIQRAIDKRAGTPAAANNFLKSMRSLFAWAVRNGHVKHDPTHNVERVKYKTDGFPVWTIDEVAAYCAYHPIGTKARLTLELLLLTGLRRSDIVRLGRQHVRDKCADHPHRENECGSIHTITARTLAFDCDFTDRRIAFFGHRAWHAVYRGEFRELVSSPVPGSGYQEKRAWSAQALGDLGRGRRRSGRIS